VIKCVIFDFDGTLVESNDIKRRVFYEVSKNIEGADLILDKLFSANFSGDRYKVFNTIIEDLFKTKKTDISSKYLSDLYTKICEYEVSRAPEIFGASRTLEELKRRNIKIIVSSATPVETLKFIIKMRGWSDLFDGVMGTPESKEDHLKSILSINNYSLSEVVYVGDSEIDRMASLSIGCKFIGIGNDWRRFDVRPEVLLKTLEKLIEELKL
jgi:phosphoglycolate phosphatase-like HAD superfamily hydrolase